MLAVGKRLPVVAALGVAVLHIFGVRPNEQVGRVHACRIVALVADAKTSRIHSVNDGRDSMGEHLASVADSKATVWPFFVDGVTNPVPTIVRAFLVYVPPEPIDDALREFHCNTQRTSPAGCGAAKREPAGGRSVVGECLAALSVLHYSKDAA
jgi:hypothetical protein